MDFAENLKDYRKNKGITQRDLADIIGTNNTTLSNWEKGISKPDIDTIIKISNYFGISIDDLIFSAEEKKGKVKGKVNGNLLNKIEENTESHAVLRKELYQDEQNKELLALQAERGIPLIPDYAFAGFAPGNDIQILELNCEKYVIPHFKGADGLIHVKGSSMYPKYNSGDIVAFKKLSMGTFFQWNKVYIIDTEQGLLIKRVQQADDGEHIILVSDNPNYKPFPLPLTDIYSLAIVVGVIRLE